MKKIITYAGISMCLFAVINLSAQTAKKMETVNPKSFHLNKKMVEDVDYVKGHIIFQVKDQYRGNCSAGYINDTKLTQVLNFLGVSTFGKIYPNHKPLTEKKNSIGQEYADLSLIYELKFKNTNISLEKAINLMLSTGLFNYAEPRYQYFHCSIFPNDPNANTATKLQYKYLNRVKAYNVWDTVSSNLVGPKGHGDTNIVIGIVDSGTDLVHPDLINQFKHNYADPIGGGDQDGDTYIDNFTGWDLAGADYNNVVGDNSPQIMGSNNVHGSHVSGDASAQTNNAVGVAGIGWNCKLLPVKTAADNDTRGTGGEGYIIMGYEGITYAADHGARVINCSWGGTGGGSYGQSIITYASINKNSVVVCAAGNSTLDQAFYPAAFVYCLSVAACNASSDIIATFSNWNYSVDITSPGVSIYNTAWSNSYQSMSGTSMASPITAGGVALVLSKWPTYTGLQAAQRLINTSDSASLYSANNTTYANKLGKGRTNLYRALTDPASPSVVFTNSLISDHNDMAFTQGDTLFISGDFINYLSPTSGTATATISIAAGGGAFITGINTNYPLGVMATNSLKNNSTTPYTFKINGAPPLNNTLTLQVKIRDGSYTQSYFIDILLNPDYVNIAINDVSTTITSHGRIGWNADGEMMGLGFTYLGDQLLYEGGLMIGNSSSNVSNCVRGATAGVGDMDFGALVVAQKVGPFVSDFDVLTKFNDAPSITAAPIGIAVHQNAYAWTSPGSRKFVICEYIIKNTTGSTLSNLWPGIFCDWDIDAATASANKANYDATRELGYCYSPALNGYYAGIRLLTNTAPANCYSIDNTGTGRGGVNLSSVFSAADKYTTLSTPRAKAGDSSLVSYTGNDVCQVMSSGPFTIAAGDSIKVAFAILAGDNLAQLQTSSDSAWIRYNPSTGVKTNTNHNFVVYPNPSADVVNFVFGSNQSDNYTITLTNVMGQTVKTIQHNASGQGLHTATIDVSDLAAGTYIYKVTSPASQPTVGKIIVKH